MQRLEVTGAVRLIYRSLGFKGLILLFLKREFSLFSPVAQSSHDSLNKSLKWLRGDN